MTLAKLKSTISVVLIISMLITTGGIKTLAESIDDVVKNEIASNNKKDNFYGETFSTGSNLLVNDDVDGEGEGENDIYGTEDEPEEDTETTESVGESNDVEQDASEESSTSEESSSVIESSELEETSETIDNTSSFNDIVASESEVVDEDISSESEPIYESIASESEIINDSIASTSDIFALNEIDLATDSLLKSATISIIDNNLLGSSPINNIIWFGTYPQQDATGVQYEPIKWRVLSQDGNEALLLAENILDNILDNSSETYWNASELRTWLNETFKNKAFTANQINNGIISNTISTNGIDTTDKIFLLSYDDTVNNNYFPNIESKKAIGSNYARSVVNNGHTLEVYNGYSPWWLRTAISSTPYFRRIIDCDGDVDFSYYDSTDVGVRPAFYADLSSDIFKTSNNGISFNLHGASWKAESTLWGEMTAYQGGQKLPTADNLDNFPANKAFIGWTINGNLDNVVTELPINQTGDIVLSPALVDVGDAIWFGTFPQHDKNGIIREPIKWRVLSNNASEALLVSDTILYNKPFNDTYGSVHWSNSSVRDWLNDEFKNEIFTDEQINNGLVTKTIQTTGQSDTEDELFLLSLEEAEQLFSNNYSRKVVATNYAKNIVYNGTKLWTDNDYAYYWLRSPGYLGTTYATFVCEDGSIDNEGYYVNDCEFSGIRPAFYLNLSSPIFKTSNNSVTFNLNGGSWKEGSELWESFDRYQGGQKLPTKENIVAPRGYEFVGWSYSGETATISEIEVDKTGDIVLEAQYEFEHILDEYIWFGTYPQGSTNLLEMEPIRWRVLDQDMTTGEVFLVSEKVLDYCNYFNSIHEASIGLGWQGSVMREYLNTTLKNRAFTRTQIENGIIEKTIYSRNKEGNYDSTIDAVFLLSKDEVENTDYFSDANDRIAYPVSYLGWGIRDPSYYWLRDILDEGYEVNSRMMYVKGDGTIYRVMAYPREAGGIRPAICVNTYILNTSDNNITFDLNGGSWKTGSELWQSFDKYQGGQKLPTIENINAPNGQMLMGWTYDGGATIINEIPSDMRGDLTLKAVYDIPAYDIIWDLTDGSSTESGYFEGGATPSDFYVYGVGVPTIPTNVIGPHGREFSHWEINGTKVTSITTSDYGNKTIKAVYINEIWFGRYPQSDTTGELLEPIKWKLLYKNDDEAFLVSEKILDNISYNDLGGRRNWETSTVRNWLNDTFIIDDDNKNYFNGIQKGVIKEKTLRNSFCLDTNDKIFLMHRDDLSYLGNGVPAYLYASATPYAKNIYNDHYQLKVYDNGASSWWLRSQSDTKNYADIIIGDNLVVDQKLLNNNTVGVRPAIYVDLTSRYFRLNNNKVYWNLGDVSFKPEAALWNDYKTYQPGQKLPSIDDILVPTGYNFSGWKINDGVVIYNEIPIVQTGDITLTPKIAIDSRRISYFRNGGEWTGPAPGWLKNYDEEVILPVASDIVKNDGNIDYVFKGWYTEDGSNTGIWDETKKVTVLPANVPLIPFEYDYVFYARWELPTYEVSFNMLDHGATPSNIEVGYNVIVPSTDRPASPNEIGYKFCGWYQNYNQAVTDFDSKYTNQFNFETDIVSANIKLYAKWKPITYTIRYNANGGSVSPATDIKIYDTNLTLANPTKEGYDFDAWYQNYESSTETFTNIYDGTIDICTLDGDIKNIYAKWLPHEYIVDYDLGLEASASGAMPPSSTITKTYGVSLADGVLQNPSVIPTGFEFIGWFKEAAFINEWTGVDDLTNGTSPQTIYAKWNLIKYNITYDALGGTLPSGTSNTFIKTYSKAVTLVNPTRVGYDFDGWYADYNAETKVYTIPFNGQVDISTDTTGKTIYAKWAAHTYYITYELGGHANPITPKLKTYGVSYTPPTPENITTGYAFAGWYKELSYVNQYLGGDLTTGTTTQVVYAKWTQNPKPSPSPNPSPSPYNPGGGGGSSGGGGGGVLAPKNNIPSVLSINTKKDIKAALNFNTCKWSYDPIKDKWQLKGDLENGLNINAVDGFYIVAREDENFNSLATGKLVIETYYFDAQGDMWKGFVKTADNKTYYFDATYDKKEGLMAIGWTKIVNDWYYFGTDGTMIINSVTPDGYQVGEDGKWIQ